MSTKQKINNCIPSLLSIIIILINIYNIQSFAQTKDTMPIAIIYSAGSKGYFLPYKVYDSIVLKDLKLKPGSKYGGYAAIAKYIKDTKKELKQKKGTVILVDGGNSLVGCSEADFFKGKFTVNFMNKMGYNAITISNLDWNLTSKNVEELSGLANFAFLNASMVEKKTKKCPAYLKPYTIVNFNGIKLGILGYAQDNIAVWLSPKSVPGLMALPTYSTVRYYVNKLKQAGVDLIIAVDHTGGETHKNVVKNIDGIDVMIDGAVEWAGVWTKRFTADEPSIINSTYVFPEVDSHFALGRINLIYNKKQRKIESCSGHRVFLNLEKVGEDAEIKKMVTKYSKTYFELLGKKLDESIGYATDDLTTDWKDDWTTSLGTHVCNGMREGANADVAIQNIGGIRRHIKKGPIKVKDVQNALPFKNNLVTFKVKGSNVWRVKLLYYKAGSGNVPWIYVGGMTIKRNKNRDAIGFLIDGKPIQNDKVYTFVTNSYLYSSNYINRDVCYDIKELDKKISEAVVEYVKKYTPLSPDNRETGTHYDY